MKPSMPKKRFRYTIEHPTGETEMSIDPKGWDGHEIGFDRSDDFGLNIQNVVPLSFSGNSRTLLKGLYETSGQFAKSKVRIDRRLNDWTYAPYYTYRHDYTTYKDNLHFVEMGGVEDGLLSKIKTYKDTEYEIALPVSVDKTFLAYTGASVVRSNQIQMSYGEMDEKGGIAHSYFAIKGTRAVRSYDDSLAFTDSDGQPYPTMTVRCIKSGTFDIDLVLKCTITANAAFLESTPSPGRLKVVTHNADFSAGTAIYSYPNYSTRTTGANNREDIFNTTATISVALTVGQLLTIFYRADDTDDRDLAYSDVTVDDGAKAYIETSHLVTSVYKDANLEVFTYEWLIESLLKKIDSSAQLISSITYPNIKEFLSCTTCIKSLGNINNAANIKVKLSDVLESFNKLKCIAIDITGNIMSIVPRGDVYSGVANTLMSANNIVLNHDIKHQYSSFIIGADADDREDDDPLIYPFICEKRFKVSDSILDSELDLKNNFMLDPYQIDKYITETLSKADNIDEDKFAIFACRVDSLSFTTDVNSPPQPIQYEENVTFPYLSFYGMGDSPVKLPNIVFDSPQTYDFELVAENRLVKYTFATVLDRIVDIDVELAFSGVPMEQFNSAFIHVYLGDGLVDIYYIDEESFTGDPTERNGGIYRRHMKFKPNIIIAGINGSESYNWVTFGMDIKGTWEDAYVNKFNISVTEPLTTLYKNQTMSNFQGDAATVYNVPLTPKRILQRHKEYLAISTKGQTTPKVEFVSTSIQSAITSRCGFETADVVENTDLVLTGVDPMFLPTTIQFDTEDNVVDIDTFEDVKYKYLSIQDEKTGKTYTGWINNATFAVSKNKSKSITLQAKTI